MAGLTMRAAAVLLAALLPLAGASAQQIYSDEDLVGTIWSSQGTENRTSVDHAGEITRGTSDGNYFEVLEYNEGVFVFMINWWNEEAGLNVVEYGVLVPDQENSYLFLEAEDRRSDGHPGVSGHGFFQVVNQNTARFVQLGRAAGGAAMALTSVLSLVEAPPNVPIPQSHPTR